MGRTNGLALRLKGLLNWPSNIRHQFLSKYIKHVFQQHIVAEPGIRASTTGIWVNVTLLEQKGGEAIEAKQNQLIMDPVLDLKEYSIWGKEKASEEEAGYDFMYGRNELRVRNLLHGGRARPTESTIAKPHFFYGRLSKNAPLNQMEALGLREDFARALQIYKDTPIHLRINVIKNPLLNADVLAQFVAQELSRGVPLPKLHKGLLTKISTTQAK